MPAETHRRRRYRDLGADPVPHFDAAANLSRGPPSDQQQFHELLVAATTSASAPFC